MNHWIVSGACALSLVACTKEEPPASKAGAPASAPAAKTARVLMELGKDV
jgi:hypothetical protein